MEYRQIKKIKHYVYDSLDEYRAHRVGAKDPCTNWRIAKEGAWVYSDDGRIVQLLKVKNNLPHPNDSRNYKLSNGYVRTVVGTFIISDKTEMDTDFDAHPNRYTFSQKIKNTNSRVKERKNVTTKEKMFATMVAAGNAIEKAYTDSYGTKHNVRKKAVMLIKQDRVMKEIEKSVMDIAKSQGIDHEWILRRLKLLAEHSEDENIQLRAVVELGKTTGTLGTTVKKQEVGIMGMFQGFKEADMIQAERPKEISEDKDSK
jgi:cell division protein FtsL